MKRSQHGGYPTWRCRRCGSVFGGEPKRKFVDFDWRHISEKVSLYSASGKFPDYFAWTYMSHRCADGGIGVGEFVGLSSTKTTGSTSKK